MLRGILLHMANFCTFTGCEREPKARGLCAYHYNRGRKEGWLLRLGPKVPGECCVERCDNPVLAKGMCQTHYQRHNRSEQRVSLDSPLRERPPFWECSVEGCAKRHAGDGVCRSHGSTFDGDTAEFRLCDTCGEVLPRSAFYSSPGRKDTDRNCIKCRRATARIAHIRRTYGEGAVEWARRLDSGEPCGICGKFKPNHMCIDHCHDTGEVRGILCRTCNAAIGQLGDSVDMLRSAVKYLEESCVS